jgi:hypothetical protein
MTWSTLNVSSAFSRFALPVFVNQLWLNVTASGRSP